MQSSVAIPVNQFSPNQLGILLNFESLYLRLTEQWQNEPDRDTYYLAHSKQLHLRRVEIAVNNCHRLFDIQFRERELPKKKKKKKKKEKGNTEISRD